MVAFVENAFRRMTGGENNKPFVKQTIEVRTIDNSGPFLRRRRFAELTQPRQTSQSH
jgi:hypothetical protein